MFGLPKSVRVRHSRDFRRVMDHGMRVSGPLLVVFLAPRQDAASSAERPAVDDIPPPIPAGISVRLGPIASRKVGDAVTRNRIKRHVREAYRRLRPELVSRPAFAGMDIVVVARAAAATASGTEIASALRGALLKLERRWLQADAASRPGGNSVGGVR